MCAAGIYQPPPVFSITIYRVRKLRNEPISRSVHPCPPNICARIPTRTETVPTRGRCVRTPAVSARTRSDTVSARYRYQWSGPRSARRRCSHAERTTNKSLRVVVHSRRGSSNARDICAYQIKHARGRCAHAAGTYTPPEKLSGLVPPRAGTVLDLAKLVRLRAIPTLVEFNTRAHHAPPAGGLGYHPETNARSGTRSMYTMYNYSCACAPL